jgi:hypothetical protein
VAFVGAAPCVTVDVACPVVVVVLGTEVDVVPRPVAVGVLGELTTGADGLGGVFDCANAGATRAPLHRTAKASCLRRTVVFLSGIEYIGRDSAQGGPATNYAIQTAPWLQCNGRIETLSGHQTVTGTTA